MRMVKLGEIATVERRGVQPDQFPANTVYLGLEHIEKGGRILEYAAAIEEGLRSTKFQFTSNHVLYGKLRPYLAKIALPDREGICSTDILPVLPGPELDRTYLAYYLRQGSLVDFAASRASGANLPRLSARQLEQFPVPVPPLEEQRRIAAILDKADAIRTKRRQVLAHLDALPEDIYRDQFSEIPASVTVADLAETAKNSIRTGPFGSQLLHSEFVESGISVLGLDNVVGNSFAWGTKRFITERKYRQLERYTVHGGDVLISIMGTTGRCVVVPDDIPIAINTKHICAITPDVKRVHPEVLRASFLWHPESRLYLLRQTKGSIMAGLNMGIIKTMPVPSIPMKKQLDYARVVSEVNTAKGYVEAALQADDALFASLQTRAFKGEL